jgi:hypothetical protein
MRVQPKAVIILPDEEAFQHLSRAARLRGAEGSLSWAAVYGSERFEAAHMLKC